MNYHCELRTPDKNLPIIDRVRSSTVKPQYLIMEIPSRFTEVLNRVNIFGEEGLFRLNGKVAKDTIPLLAECVKNLELGVNTYAELDAVKRLREIATTEPDAIWDIYT